MELEKITEFLDAEYQHGVCGKVACLREAWIEGSREGIWHSFERYINCIDG